MFVIHLGIISRGKKRKLLEWLFGGHAYNKRLTNACPCQGNDV